MTKTVIAVDIDEVLTPTVPALVNWHNRYYGTNLHFNDFHTYDFYKIWGGDRDSAIAKCAYYFENSPATAPFADASRVLARLKQDYALIVVTSRMLEQRAQTEKWINQHFPNMFAEILVCNHWKIDPASPAIKKSAACRQFGAKYLIDDVPNYIQDVTNEGIHGLLFGYYPWNQQIINHSLAARVADWQAVEDYFYPQTAIEN